MYPTTREFDGQAQEIARKHMGIATLETRKSDSMDFHDVAVWSLRAALEAAYRAGIDAGIMHEQQRDEGGSVGGIAAGV